MQTPLLTPDDVLVVLEAIHSASPLPKHHPIFSFLWVQAHLQAPHALRGDFAVIAILSDLLRGILGEVLGELTQVDPVNLLLATFQEDDTRQRAYGLLFQRYLQHSDLPREQVASLLGLEIRSLQRHQKEALHLLTVDLIQQEMGYRRQHRQMVWLSHLGQPIPLDSFGRDGLLERATALLAQNFPVALLGMSGVGKTSLAMMLAMRLWDTVEDCVWLKLCPHVSLERQIMDSGGWSDWAEVQQYNALHSVLWVLDQLQAEHLAELSSVLAGLSHSPVLITCPIHFDLTALDLTAFLVPPLTSEESYRFYAQFCGHLPLSEWEPAWVTSGGLPADLLAYIRWRRHLPSSRLLTRLPIYEDYSRHWQALSPTQQLLVEILYWSHDHVLPAFLLDLLSDGEWQKLVQMGFSTPEANGYSLNPPALAFLGSHLTSGQIDLDLSPLWASPSWFTSEGLEYFATLTLTPWINHWRVDQLRTLIEQVGRAMLTVRLWSLWEQVLTVWGQRLQHQPSLQVLLELERGRLLRGRGLLATARRQFQVVLMESGQHGFFLWQGRTWLELAWVALYQQEWSTAQLALEHASLLFYRWDTDQHYKTDLAIAQAWYALGVGSDFQTPLWQDAQALPLPLVLPLCELARLQGQADFAIQLITDRLEAVSPTSTLYARLLNMLAVCYWSVGQLEWGLRYQIQAVNLLLALNDDFAVVRALNNLGALYFYAQEWENCRSTWQRAKEHLLRLQDRATFQVVAANLQLLEQQVPPTAQPIFSG